MSTALDVDLGLDLGATNDVEIPCRHSQHAERHQPDGPAEWMATFWCEQPDCGNTAEYPICDIGRMRMLSRWTVCSRCARARKTGVILGMRFRPLERGDRS